MNECLMTPQHKNKLAIGFQTNGVYIKSYNQIHIYKKFIKVQRKDALKCINGEIISHRKNIKLNLVLI